MDRHFKETGLAHTCALSGHSNCILCFEKSVTHGVAFAVIESMEAVGITYSDRVLPGLQV